MSDQELKNVVIIGSSASGGAGVAHSLEKTLPKTHRIVLIEANEFAYWPIGSLRASVKPEYEKEIFASFDNFFEKSGGKNSRNIVLAGYKVVEIKKDQITLDKEAPAPFNSITIPVDIGVIASGTIYPAPMRPVSTKIEENVTHLKQLQKDVASAENFVIIGGSAVGVEFTGEILAEHPNKKITIVHNGPHLMPGWKESLHKKLFSQLKAKNVQVKFNTKAELTEELIKESNKKASTELTIKLSDGSELKSDFLFIANGGKPNVGFVPESALSNDGPRRVRVDPKTLRLEDETFKSNWFAIGDACNTKEIKTAFAASLHAPIIANHIIAQLTQNKKVPKGYGGSMDVIVVPLGPKDGATFLFVFTLGQWFTSFAKGKALLAPMFIAAFPGGLPLKEKKAS